MNFSEALQAMVDGKKITYANCFSNYCFCKKDLTIHCGIKKKEITDECTFKLTDEEVELQRQGSTKYCMEPLFIVFHNEYEIYEE